MVEQGPPQDDEMGFDLDCPSCSCLLSGEDTYERFRVCPVCRRHFWIPARERIDLLVEERSFRETNASLVSVDPLVFRDPLPLPDRMAGERERSGVSEAVITGTALVGANRAVLILLDLAFLGGNIGIVAGEKITLAMEAALNERIPLIAVCSGGAMRTQEGLLSVVQLAKTSAAAARLHAAGVPFVSLLTHPTIGGVYAGLASHADLVFAEPGAHIGFNALRESAGPTPGGAYSAEVLLGRGYIDDLVDRTRQRDVFASIGDLFAKRSAPRSTRRPSSQLTVNAEPTDVPPPPQDDRRLTSLDYVDRMVTSFVELHGDRSGCDDPAVVAGFGRLDTETVAIIALERGRGGDRTDRHDGRLTAASFRKAARLMRLAGHLETPLVTLVDTPGLMGGDVADAEGLGIALSQTLGLISILPVPIVSVVIGEAGSAGAFALTTGDRSLMLERAAYTVVGPEGASELAPPSKVSARDCLRLGIIDRVIPDTSPSAQANPDLATSMVQSAVLQALAELRPLSARRLLEERARKVRSLGIATPEGREAAHRELSEFQEWQRLVSRSLTDLRERLEQRQRGLPNRGQRPHLPSLPNLRRINVNRTELADLANRLKATGRGLVRSQSASDRDPTG